MIPYITSMPPTIEGTPNSIKNIISAVSIRLKISLLLILFFIKEPQYP